MGDRGGGCRVAVLVSALMVKRGRRYVPADACDVITAALELQVREIDGTVCAAPEVTRDFLLRALGSGDVERFACVWLDNRHRVIKCDVMFTGTIDRAGVHPREIVRRCIERNAAAVILEEMATLKAAA